MTLKAEAIYPINFTKPKKDLYQLYILMKTTVSYLLMLQKYISSKQKSLIHLLYTLCLGNISKDLTINSLKKKRIRRSCKTFFC